MYGYVIIRTDQGGGYLAPGGANQVWVRDVKKAHLFATREAAESFGVCPENERVVPVIPSLRG